MFRFLRWVPVFAIALVLAACSTKIDVPAPQSQSQLHGAEYGYPADYHEKSITEQVLILREIFPELKESGIELPRHWLPKGAEWYFVIPQWQMIAPTYGEAVERVFGALERRHSFDNEIAGRLGPEYLRESERSLTMWKRLAKQQNDAPLLLVPAQFGMRYRDRSVQDVRASFEPNEFGLGAYAVGIMLLTHPERLQQEPHTYIGAIPSYLYWINAVGDEYESPAAFGYSSSHVPIFRFMSGDIQFYNYWTDSGASCWECGSATAFVP